MTLCKLLGVAACGALMATALMAAEKPDPAHNQDAVAAKKTVRSAWPPETLSGQILMVDPAKKLVVVKGPSGVPFDMDVSASTRIRSGNQKLTLKDLASDRQKNVSVRFVPERRGDVARSIQVTG